MRGNRPREFNLGGRGGRGRGEGGGGREGRGREVGGREGGKGEEGNVITIFDNCKTYLIYLQKRMVAMVPVATQRYGG